jgi:hypothetical protein
MSRIQAPVYAQAAADHVTASFPNTPTQGNLLIAFGKSVSGTASGSIPGWTLAISARVGASTTFIDILYKIAGAGESKDVTYTQAGGNPTDLVIEEYDTFNTLDKTAKVDTTGGGVTSRSSGTTATTTANDELVLALIGTGNFVTGQSWGSSFTEEFAKPVGNLTFFGASKVLSTTGTPETTLSWSTSRVAAGVIATFKYVSAGKVIPVFMNQYSQRRS